MSWCQLFCVWRIGDKKLNCFTENFLINEWVPLVVVKIMLSLVFLKSWPKAQV